MNSEGIIHSSRIAMLRDKLGQSGIGILLTAERMVKSLPGP